MAYWLANCERPTHTDTHSVTQTHIHSQKEKKALLTLGRCVCAD